MKILVTGATGFIGKNVVKQLLNYNYEVIATSIEPHINIQHPNLKYISSNINELSENAFNLFSHPDVLIHLAWENLPNYKELFHIEKNLISNYNFVKNLIVAGLKNVVCIGTCFEYGMQNGCLSEYMETKPNTMYGLAKDTLRKFIEALQKSYEFDFKWLRLFYPYGKGQNPHSLISQLQKAIINNESSFNMSSGEQIRDYLPVETVAEYIIKCSFQSKQKGIINICSGTPISVRKFVENYLLENNAKINLNLGYYPYCDYEPLAFWGDSIKLKKAVT
jgi:dTDP-6-deoxy-L-talose 4-dehydrogenase (NAD+)